jgi:RND family efflux transporter MFP subunit
MFLMCGADVMAATHVALVEVAQLERYDVQRRYAGQTVASRTSQLGFKQAGEIEQIDVDIGDRVIAGQALARLDGAALQAGVEQAEAAVELSAANVQAVRAATQLKRNTEERFRELLRKGHVSDQQYDEQALSLDAQSASLDVARAELERAKAQLRAARVALDEASIHAPFAGVIQRRQFDEGSQVGPGQAVFTLIETSHPEAHVGIPVSVAPSLAANSMYEFAWEGRTMVGRLVTVLPEVDAASRTQTAVFGLDTEAAVVPLGSVIELELTQSVPTRGFWVPISALTASDRGLWGIYVVNDAAETERRLVEVIHSESERAYVRGTLADGEQIVATGVQRIVPGQAVVVDAALGAR